MKSLSSIAFLAVLTIGLFLSSELYASTKKGQKVYQQTKEYKVPGPVVISAAKRHGYYFTYSSQSKRRNKNKLAPKACNFVGHHWQIASNKSCTLYGFSEPWKRSNRRKCTSLREGWKIKKIELEGSYVWKSRPSNTTRPKFVVKSENKSSSMKNVSIKSVTLVGPKGKFNKFEEAFSHCSDNSYRG